MAKLQVLIIIPVELQAYYAQIGKITSLLFLFHWNYKLIISISVELQAVTISRLVKFQAYYSLFSNKLVTICLLFII